MSATSTVQPFDLRAEVKASLSDILSPHDQEALIQAVSHDAAIIVQDPSLNADDLPLEEVQRRLLQRLVDQLHPTDSSPKDLPEPPDVSSPIQPVNLAKDMSEIFPGFDEDAILRLSHIFYTHLENLTGERLTRGMPDEQLDEFGYFVDMDEERMTGWLLQHCPGFDNDKGFQEICAQHPDAPRPTALAEFGAKKWLELNRPDYPDIVNQTRGDLMSALVLLQAIMGEEAFQAWAHIQRARAQEPGERTNNHGKAPHEPFPLSPEPADKFTAGLLHGQWRVVDEALSHLTEIVMLLTGEVE